MDEAAFTEQIKTYMEKEGISQAELGRKVVPDSANGRQTVNQYLGGKRRFFTGTGAAILDALGLEVVVRPKRD